MNHSLVQLANKFNRTRVDEICSAKFCTNNGRPALPSRLVVGLLLIKIKIMLSGDRKLTPAEKKKLNQRSKIESTIGLMKSKCRMDLN